MSPNDERTEYVRSSSSIPLPRTGTPLNLTTANGATQTSCDAQPSGLSACSCLTPLDLRLIWNLYCTMPKADLHCGGFAGPIELCVLHFLHCCSFF